MNHDCQKQKEHRLDSPRAARTRCGLNTKHFSCWTFSEPSFTFQLFSSMNSPSCNSANTPTNNIFDPPTDTMACLPSELIDPSLETLQFSSRSTRNDLAAQLPPAPTSSMVEETTPGPNGCSAIDPDTVAWISSQQSDMSSQTYPGFPQSPTINPAPANHKVAVFDSEVGRIVIPNNGGTWRMEWKRYRKFMKPRDYSPPVDHFQQLLRAPGTLINFQASTFDFDDLVGLANMLYPGQPLADSVIHDWFGRPTRDQLTQLRQGAEPTLRGEEPPAPYMSYDWDGQPALIQQVPVPQGAEPVFWGEGTMEAQMNAEAHMEPQMDAPGEQHIQASMEQQMMAVPEDYGFEDHVRKQPVREQLVRELAAYPTPEPSPRSF
jgi:hypothetical protein